MFKSTTAATALLFSLSAQQSVAEMIQMNLGTRHHGSSQHAKRPSSSRFSSRLSLSAEHDRYHAEVEPDLVENRSVNGTVTKPLKDFYDTQIYTTILVGTPS